MRRALAAVLAIGLLAAACGDDDGPDVDTAPPETTAPGDTAPDDGAAPPDDDTAPPDPDDLPGERIDIFPFEGAELAVVGVEAHDTLNVRAGPGVEFDVVFELDPLATGIAATGHNRSLDEAGIWSEIVVDDRTGWANTVFLLHPGQVDDITAQIAPTPPERPRAETMVQLGRMVAETRAAEEPPSDIVVVEGPTVADLAEITVDVIGLGDDSVGGERLHVFAEEEPGGEGFVLRSVEATTLCLRGVTDDGLCV